MNQNILLLHGALGTKAQFNSLKKKLSDLFKVHDFDFEGHGLQVSNRDFTVPLFVESVIQYLNKHKIEKTHIFGYSMGGYVALNVARAYPERVEKIITLGTKFLWTKEVAEREMKMLNPEKMEEKVPFFAKKLASMHGNGNWKNVVEKTAKMMYGLGVGEKLTDENLEEIVHKILIAIGDRDEMVSIEESESSASLLPNGQLKVIEGFPHPIEKVNEEELKSIIVDFVEK